MRFTSQRLALTIVSTGLLLLSGIVVKPAKSLNWDDIGEGLRHGINSLADSTKSYDSEKTLQPLGDVNKIEQPAIQIHKVTARSSNLITQLEADSLLRDFPRNSASALYKRFGSPYYSSSNSDFWKIENFLAVVRVEFDSNNISTNSTLLVSR